ncbi:MAG: acetate--CoA ligase family protein [archaeon]
MKGLTEKEAEDLLEKEKFNVVKRAVARNKSDFNKISRQIEFPWVMKAASSKIVHKAKVGGVVLNIKNISSAENAFDKLKRIKGFEKVMIQERVHGEELIVGIKRTPEFSHVLMFGKGGTNVQKENDVSFRALPVSVDDVKEMMAETKVFSLLKKKKVKIAVVEQNLMKMSRLAEKYPSLLELDINPLIVNNKNAVVVDARILFG